MSRHSVAGFLNGKGNWLGDISLPIMAVLCVIVAISAAIVFPGYATNTEVLGFLIFLQIVLAAVWDYRQKFFPLLVLVFLFAGTGFPPNGFWDMERWLVLGVGAVAGLVNYFRGQHHSFGSFHLVAFFCVIAAAVSASVSLFPKDSLFKVLSFCLLLLYAVSGLRFAVAGVELTFLYRLLLFSEVLTYVTAPCYFILHYDFFGNPNSLGAVMGVLVVPLILWGVFLSEGRPAQKRHIFALVLAVLLLATSYARAGILAAAVSCLLVCIALRRYRTLVMLTGVALLAAVAAVFISPPVPDQPPSLASAFIYKGHRQQGVFESRKSPWQETVSSVNEHPWFGTGFGTSPIGGPVREDSIRFRSTAINSREHGNSYLAVLEWVGLLGVGPFAALVLMVATNVVRSLVRMRRFGSPLSPVVPIVGVIVAGLVHAAFEDWLFAIGYYLCVLFWALAFVLVDVLAMPEHGPSDQTRQPQLGLRPAA